MLSYARGLQKTYFWVFSSNGGVFRAVLVGLCGHSALQSFKCVCGGCGYMLCAYTMLVFTTIGTAVLSSLWHGCTVVKLTFYLHQTSSWLCLLWTYFTSDQGMDKLTSWHNVQIMPGLHRIRSIVDMHQVREYPDSTVSKVLTVLKWLTIPTLNRKQLEKQRVEPLCFL